MRALTLLLLLLAAGFVGWQFARWRSQAAQPRRGSVIPGTATEVKVVAPAQLESPHPYGESLGRQHSAAMQQLWCFAFGAIGRPGPPPIEHRVVAEAAQAVLVADNLPDRFCPRRPLLLQQLQAAVDDPDAAPGTLTAVISQDPVLAGNVLRLANSTFHRRSAEPVESIHHAVVVCGTDGLHSLAAAALMQPLFRASADFQTRLPALLWEHCSRAAVASELCARLWRADNRQAAQLLALTSALGPLVVYRIVQDQYRERGELPPHPAVFLDELASQSAMTAHKVAKAWQSAPRILAALAAAADPGSREDLLARALQAGELLAALSLLHSEGQVADAECRERATAAGIPREVFETVWERLSRTG